MKERNQLQKRKKSSTSKMGISVKKVSSRGKQPNCQYCHQDIARGEWHTVNICEKPSNSGNNIWKHQIHYHLYCFHSLTRKEQQQLLAVVDLNSAVDDDGKRRG